MVAAPAPPPPTHTHIHKQKTGTYSILDFILTRKHSLDAVYCVANEVHIQTKPSRSRCGTTVSPVCVCQTREFTLINFISALHTQPFHSDMSSHWAYFELRFRQPESVKITIMLDRSWLWYKDMAVFNTKGNAQSNSRS